jgi:hypothetical protein
VDDAAVKKLFKGYAPLSSFSSRVDIAFALGFVPKILRDELSRIRKIRNHFAHHPDVTSFEVSPVKDWCGGLLSSEFGIHDATSGGILSRPRFQFFLSVALCFLYFEYSFRDTKRFSLPNVDPPKPQEGAMPKKKA